MGDAGPSLVLRHLIRSAQVAAGSDPSFRRSWSRHVRHPGAMTARGRFAIAAYLLVLTVGLLAGHWPLQGPLLFGTGGHGVHAGDLVVLGASAVVCFGLYRTPR